MARKRFVSPKFFMHAELYDAEVASALPLRLGFEALWCQADRRGLFVWRPRELKLQCLPYDPCDFAAVLEALERFGFIRSYEVQGKRYGYIPTLKDHQSFHQAEKPDPTIPDPPPGAFDHATTPAPGQHSASTVLTPGQPGACSTVAVAVAVAVTDTVTATGTGTVGVAAPGQHHQPPGLAVLRSENAPPEPFRVPEGVRHQYDELVAVALPHQRAALDFLLSTSRLPEVVVGIVHAIATGMHPIVSKSGVTAGVEHVLMAVAESAVKFFEDGRRFDKPLFEGCVRAVVNRKPEPTPAEQREHEAAIQRVAPALRFELPRTPEDEQQAATLRRQAMREFWTKAGRPDKAATYAEGVAA